MAKAQPIYKRCKKGVGKSGAKKGRLLQGYIWPGGGKCPVKAGKKAAKKPRKARARKSKPRSVASYHKSQAAAAGRYGAGAESFIRRQRAGAASRGTVVIPKGSSYYSAQSAALNRIYGKNQSMAGARRRRRRR